MNVWALRVIQVVQLMVSVSHLGTAGYALS